MTIFFILISYPVYSIYSILGPREQPGHWIQRPRLSCPDQSYSEIDLDAKAEIQRSFKNPLRRHDIQGCDPNRIENGYFIIAFSSRQKTGKGLSNSMAANPPWMQASSIIL
jgi:hypothetical protein